MSRETWAFNLHWQNDEALYRTVLAYAGNILDRKPDVSDPTLGLYVVAEVLSWCQRGFSTWHAPIERTRPWFRVTKATLDSLALDIDNEWGEIDLEDVAVAVREDLQLEAGE